MVNPIKRKLLIIGDEGVGKTEFVNGFIGGVVMKEQECAEEIAEELEFILSRSGENEV